MPPRRATYPLPSVGGGAFLDLKRVRVRRERPTALAWALALCVTMLVVYVLTLNAGRPDVVESMAPAPRVTREIAFEGLKGWCVQMAACDSDQAARLAASAYSGRGAGGYVAQIEGEWAVLGAVYESEQDAARIARRLSQDEGIPSRVVCLEAEPVKLRITAPEAQIDAIAEADALLRRETRRLGEIALQLDRGELRPEAARTLCGVSAEEAATAARALSAIPGAAENALCAGLIGRLETLSDMEKALSGSGEQGASLSGMVRCAQIENFVGQRGMQEGLSG